MKDFFSEFMRTLTTPPGDHWMDYGILAVVWVLVLMVVGLVLFGVLSLIDGTFLSVQEGTGQLISKHFEESHTTTVLVYNAALKTSLPHTTYHPDAWKLGIQVGDGVGDFYVSATDYVKLKVQQRIDLTYTIGRLWGTLYIKTISL